MNNITQFLLLVLVINVLSYKNKQLMFRNIYSVVGSINISYIAIWIIYFPGILVHELSHGLSALALFIPINRISLIPKSRKQGKRGKEFLELGSVHYVEKDYIRSSIVAIAPFFGGLASLYILFSRFIFVKHSFIITALLLYLAFSISSMMFSSKEDLTHAIRIVPFLIIIGILIIIYGKAYFSNIIIISIESQYISTILVTLNKYLVIVTLVNIALFTFLKLFATKRV